MQQPIPQHLKKYIVDQTQQKYSPEDQAVWRYIMRQLKSFLSTHAHDCYVEGFSQTGLDTESIPRIDVVNQKLQKFGWGAIPVSGFIPPAAFMEFQSLGYLPMASEMRSINHILYTPAPDIVHEAAGHAPILIHPSFAKYLKEYAQVAQKAIISHEDLDVYKAIRVLSDVKERSSSSPQEVEEAESHLKKVTEKISYTSEASLLSRMNWWTAEYGLIGEMDSPKIFGAGLLSSIGEARDCFKESVRKIHLSVDCVKYNYDITEQQPQLFVAKDFQHLSEVLKELAETMAFRVGGLHGLHVAQKAQTVNTVEFHSGLQISGILSEIMSSPEGEATFIKFNGPTQISFNNHQLKGHNKEYHSHGYSTPLGSVGGLHLCDANKEDLQKLQLIRGQETQLQFDSGITLKGVVSELTFEDNQLLLVSFKDCYMNQGNLVLFEPSWGTFDLAIGSKPTSVFNGPADKESYGEFEDTDAFRIPITEAPPEKLELYDFYQRIREERENSRTENLKQLYENYFNQFSENWLPGLELLELLAMHTPESSDFKALKEHLSNWSPVETSVRNCIEKGLHLVLVHK